MNKKSVNQWISYANNAVANSKIVVDGKINKTYDGKAAALGVSISMMGLKPTLVSYYNVSKNSSVNTRHLLSIVANMICAKCPKMKITSAQSLVKEALATNDDNKLKATVLECAVAVKMIIRTYSLVENKNED